jgi:putative intracellular protease/amidase
MVRTSHDQFGSTGRKTGFWLEEFAAPFLVEDMLKERGGKYSKAANWQPHVVTDGLLITGQNPASSEPAAKELLAKLRAA